MPEAPSFDPAQPFETLGGAAPPFDPSKPFEVDHGSALEAGATGLLQGATANWSDEMMAASAASGLPQWVPGTTPIGAARLAYEHITGQHGPASQVYDETVKQLRERNKKLQSEHPLTYGAGEFGGALASMAVAPEARAAGWTGRLASSAGTGAAYGALSGAGEGEGAGDSLKGAGEGAVIGGTLGAAGSLAYEALAPGARQIANVVRGMRNPDDEAARRVAEGLAMDWQHAGPALGPEEIAALNAAGTPDAVIDAGGERARALARSAANTSPEARAALTEMTHARFETQSPRIAEFIRGLTGGADAGADSEVLQDAARRANRPAYARAYAAGEDGIWNPELERLASSPTVREAMESAVKRGRDRAVAEGYGAFNPGVTFDNGIMRFGQGRGAPPYPNMQYWDYVQRELRDTASAAQRAGRNEEYATVTGLRRRLLGELDSANPAFAAARQGAARFFGADNALDAGQQFVRSNADIGEAQRALARMSPAERELFARGYASNLAAAVERAGNNRNVLNAAFFNNTAAQQRTLLALGAPRAQQLETLLRAERVIDRPRTAIGGNSTTARQLMEMGLAGGATAGAEGLLDHNFNPAHVLTAAFAVGLARHGAQVIDQRVARRVGEMLASNDASVLANGVRIASRNPAILNVLRQMTGAVARGGTEPAQQTVKHYTGFKHGGKVHSRSPNDSDAPKIDRSHTVPYLAGSSNDGRNVYIDRRVPRQLSVKGKSFDPAKYLVIHETTEHARMRQGEAYEVAHRHALTAEQRAVEADGIDWPAYQEKMHKLAERIEKAPHPSPPKDLYLKPYPHKEALLLKHEAKDGRSRVPGELTEANKANHAEVAYVDPSPHKKQRCELCTKFIAAEDGGPACKKVKSPIAPSGWCKRFVKA